MPLVFEVGCADDLMKDIISFLDQERQRHERSGNNQRTQREKTIDFARANVCHNLKRLFETAIIKERNKDQ